MTRLPGERRGRRWYTAPAGGGSVWWCAWRLFERMSGVAPSQDAADAAIEHFLEAESTYSMAKR